MKITNYRIIYFDESMPEEDQSKKGYIQRTYESKQIATDIYQQIIEAFKRNDSNRSWVKLLEISNDFCYEQGDINFKENVLLEFNLKGINDE